MLSPRQSLEAEWDEILGDLFVATHGGKTAHDLPGNLDQHDYAQAKAALLKTVDRYVEEQERLARVDELERILEAGNGKDFTNQMANAVGQVGKRYNELKGIQNDD